MEISLIGIPNTDTDYALELSGQKIIYLKNNFKFNVDLQKHNYIKLLYHNTIKNKYSSNFIQFTYNQYSYPILFNPSWNSYFKNNQIYSENIFVNLTNYAFQPIDNIDKINQLNCLCTDSTRPYYFPKITINLANSYQFVFSDWTGNNQVWLSRFNTSCACLLLGKNKCFLTCSLELPTECGESKYEFFAEYEHNTPYDELQRIDCLNLRPEFTKLVPINFPVITSESCHIDINTLNEQINIQTEYLDV
jgi:hypothetical protein